MFTMQRGTLMSFIVRRMLIVATLMFPFVAASTGMAQEPAARVSIVSPVPYQVVQRKFEPAATTAEQGRGFADVGVELKMSGESSQEDRFEYRVLSLPVALQADKATEWKPWQSPAKTIRVPEGGWYRLEVRSAKWPDEVASVEPFGIGEVFLVAGQSYATNTNDERLVVQDPMKRVAAKKVGENIWQVANDPQPAPDGSDGGSIWPALGDRLVTELNLPVGFVNVAVGGTSSTQWLPEGTLYPRLESTGKSLGLFRAVLWQQGESDVIEKTTVEQYVINIERIRRTAVDAWGFEPIWLCALSTHHPTVYNDPAGEGRIRMALQQLWTRPGFGPGPDTDLLKGENRGDAKSRRHFSAIGQRRAADMWFDVLKEYVRQP